MFNKKPSQALASFVVSPAKLSNLFSAINLAAASSTLVKAFARSLIAPVLLAKVSNARPPTAPTKSVAVTSLLLLLFIFW